MTQTIFETAGAQVLTTALSLGRMQTEALQHLAKATNRTPMAPIFAIQAELSRVATDGVEKMLDSAPVKAETTKAVKPAAKKAAPKPVETQAVAEAAPEKPATIEEVAAPKAVEAASGNVADDSITDDLSLINGIGPATAKKLSDAGIATFADLASQDDGKLAKLLEERGVKMTRFSPAEWIAEAKTFAAPV